MLKKYKLNGEIEFIPFYFNSTTNILYSIIMTALKKVKFHPDVVEYFKELLFYNKHIEKPKIKGLKTLICFLNFLFMKN